MLIAEYFLDFQKKLLNMFLDFQKKRAQLETMFSKAFSNLAISSNGSNINRKDKNNKYYNRSHSMAFIWKMNILTSKSIEFVPTVYFYCFPYFHTAHRIHF